LWWEGNGGIEGERKGKEGSEKKFLEKLDSRIFGTDRHQC